jgi:SAM-dependent methyltransferase
MENLYTHTEAIHNTKAAEIVVPVVLKYISPQSVLDVGCGLGTWLKVFKENHGISDVLGIDGSYLDKSKLAIAATDFKEVDLRESFDLGQKFDLVLSLEVAEHLPEASADEFIASLCRHSDTVLFSAAIPGQGGQNHINEQWPEYWQAKFNMHGFDRYDLIRPFIWNDNRVDVWYRQNIYVFSSKPIKWHSEIKSIDADIHPELWALKTEAIRNLNSEIANFENGRSGVKRSAKALLNAILNKLNLRG